MNTTGLNKFIETFVGDSFMQTIIVPMLGHHYPAPNELRFHSSWDWLMPVVEKIENLTDENNQVLVDFDIYSDAVRISRSSTDEEMFLINKSGENLFTTKIEAVYFAVLWFIKWYNEQQYDPNDLGSIDADYDNK